MNIALCRRCILPGIVGALFTDLKVHLHNSFVSSPAPNGKVRAESSFWVTAPERSPAEWTRLPLGLAWRMSMRKLHFLNDLSASVAREVTGSRRAGLCVATHPCGGVRRHATLKNSPG